MHEHTYQVCAPRQAFALFSLKVAWSGKSLILPISVQPPPMSAGNDIDNVALLPHVIPPDAQVPTQSAR